MLSYLHSFHAGNHADILKHTTLLYVLEYLKRKDKPCSFFDTHAGRALYDLRSTEAEKTHEAENGILRLLSEAENPEKKSAFPKNLFPYIDFVDSWIKKGFYPGSPAFELCFSERGSFVSLNELHKTEFQALENNIGRINPSCSFNAKNASGWETLRKNLPPKIRRGAILCDPSYEEKSDFTDASELVSSAHKKWFAAEIMLWYPLLANKTDEIENMKQAILASVKNQDSHTEVLDARLLVDKAESHTETSLEKSTGSGNPRLYGSGMFVVQPSFGLKEHLESVLPFLSNLLGRNGNGSFEVDLR